MQCTNGDEAKPNDWERNPEWPGSREGDAESDTDFQLIQFTWSYSAHQ